MTENARDPGALDRYADGSPGTEDNERIPATIVYAGIDVEHAGLFTGTRGQQIAGGQRH
jgi:hypothetical protein